MVYASGNIRKEKSRNLTNFLRIKKGLKKKAFEFSTLVVAIDACIRDLEQCGGFGTTSTTNTTGGVVVGGLKKKRNIRGLIQNHPAQMCSEPDDDDDDGAWSVVQERALIQALKELIPKGKDVIVTNQRCWEQVATKVPGKKKTGIQCKKKFALLVKQGFSFT